MDFGLDILGAAKFENLAVQQFPAGWWFGLFSNTFGDARRVAERLAASGRAKGGKVHLAWKDNHAFSRADFRAIAAEARKWKRIVEMYPIRWAFSGACEHRMFPVDGAALKDVVLNELPSVTYINSGPAISSSGQVWNEIHENPKGATKPVPGFFSYSFDGSDCVNENAQERKDTMAGAQVFFFWTHNFNGKRGEKDSTPRPRRRAWPTVNMFDSIVRLFETKGTTQLEPKCIWKTHSEQYADNPAPGARDNKPVLIIPGSAPVAELRAASGQTVAAARRFGPYSGIPGTSRYYFSDWGFLLAEKAKRLQGGNPIVSVVAGGRTFGTIHPAFREGLFR